VSLITKTKLRLSSCRHVDEDANTEIVILIFNGVVIEKLKLIPPLSFTVAGEEKEKIKL